MPTAERTGNGWRYTTAANGDFITIHAPDGRAAFLQGSDAANFLSHADETHQQYTDADLCREYESVLVVLVA